MDSSRAARTTTFKVVNVLGQPIKATHPVKLGNEEESSKDTLQSVGSQRISPIRKKVVDVITCPPQNTAITTEQQQAISVVMEVDVSTLSVRAQAHGIEPTIGCKQLEDDSSDMQIIKVNTTSH